MKEGLDWSQTYGVRPTANLNSIVLEFAGDGDQRPVGALVQLKLVMDIVEVLVRLVTPFPITVCAGCHNRLT